MAACHFCIFLSLYICVVSTMRHSWGAGQGSVKNLKPHPYHILETTLEVPDRQIDDQGVDFCSVFREYTSDFLSMEDFCPREQCSRKQHPQYRFKDFGEKYIFLVIGKQKYIFLQTGLHYWALSTPCWGAGHYSLDQESHEQNQEELDVQKTHPTQEIDGSTLVRPKNGRYRGRGKSIWTKNGCQRKK